MTPASFASYCSLCFVQGAIVLLPKPVHAGLLARVRARWPLVVVPAAGLIGMTFLPPVARALADDLSSLALLAVPPLAVLGIGWAIRPRHRLLVLLAPALLALAWATARTSIGNGAALVLVTLSCVALAALVAAALPAMIAKIGIVVWAAADLSIALTHRLEQSSLAITDAVPAAGPVASLHLERLQLQRIVLGSGSLEYADLFIAALLGAMLVAENRSRGPAALLVAAAGVSLAPLFLVTNVLPATVPVAVALGLVELRSRRTIGEMSAVPLQGHPADG